jgi:hypothetical protein
MRTASGPRDSMRYRRKTGNSAGRRNEPRQNTSGVNRANSGSHVWFACSVAAIVTSHPRDVSCSTRSRFHLSAPPIRSHGTIISSRLLCFASGFSSTGVGRTSSYTLGHIGSMCGNFPANSSGYRPFIPSRNSRSRAPSSQSFQRSACEARLRYHV